MAHVLTNFALNAGSYRPHADRRLSGSGIALVAGAHLAVLALAASAVPAPAITPLPALMVELVAAPAPAPAISQPRPVPPKQPAPRAVAPRRTPAPTPAAPTQLAAASETPAAAGAAQTATPAPGSTPPASAGTAPAPTPDPATTQPRFDADYLANPAPSYPPLSRRLGEEGKVLLRVFVEPGGRPGRIELKTSSGSPRLDAAAHDAVQRWQFVPARRGDEAVGAWVLVPIVFNLKG